MPPFKIASNNIITFTKNQVFFLQFYLIFIALYATTGVMLYSLSTLP